MQKYFRPFLITFLIIAAGVYTALSLAQGSGGESGNRHMRLQMEREAQLVEHFCLSRIPPVYGRAAIPAEWETALGATIRLREGTGEIVSLSKALTDHAEAIRGIQPGNSFFLATPNEYILIFRPTAGNQQFLYLSKTTEDLVSAVGTKIPLGRLGLSVTIGLLAALLITILNGLLPRR